MRVAWACSAGSPRTRSVAAPAAQTSGLPAKVLPSTALRDPFAHRLRRDGHPHGQAVGDALGQAEDVRHDPVLREREGAPGAKLGLDLVTDEERAAGPAPLADPLQIAGGRDADASLALDRFDDDRRDRVIERGVHRLEIVERDMPNPREHWLEGIPVAGVAGRREGAKGAPVVGAMRRDDPGAPGRNPRVFQCRLHRLGARIAEGDPGQSRREQDAKRSKKLVAGRRVEALVGIGELRRLRVDGGIHGRVRVAQDVDAVIGHQVEVATPSLVP